MDPRDAQVPRYSAWVLCTEVQRILRIRNHQRRKQRGKEWATNVEGQKSGAGPRSHMRYDVIKRGGDWEGPRAMADERMNVMALLIDGRGRLLTKKRRGGA